ncbi:MAG TPA: hypothetical protein VKV40_10070 [Ktedonobacteraceae bacterium]|nr:hypothetical protein [Ktedonobacteraceae bacterium]
MMGRLIKIVVVLCVLMVLLGALSFKTVAAKAATTNVKVSQNRFSASTCGWNVVPSPNGSNGGSGLTGVAVVSSNDVWAVGNSGDQRSGQVTLIEQWNGTNWQVVSSPDPGSIDNTLYAVSAVSASDIWAVGFYVSTTGVTQTMTLHWNGAKWNVVKSPSPGSLNNELFSVSARSSNDVWAVGFSASNSSSETTLIEHWNGAKWSVVKSPSPGTSPVNDVLSSVTAISASDAWAVGSSGTMSKTLTEHWNGAKWSVVKSPNPGSGGVFEGVSAVSTSDVWAAGYYTSNGSIQTLTENWNGTNWQVVASDNVGSHPSFWAVAAVSARNVWAVGSYGSSAAFDLTLTEHWNGTKWSVVKSPSPGTNSSQLEAVAALSGTDVWATGHADNNTLTENYHC